MSEPLLVYIAAWGRSGSTILGSILGALPGVFDAGELRHFWTRVGRADHVCGCGASLADCDFWRGVTQALRADPELPTEDFARIRRWQEDATRKRRTRQVLRATSISDLPATPFAGSAAALRCLHRSIALVSGSTVLVDSSKKTGYGAVLALSADAPPLVVQMVRDPRAVAYSWQRTRAATPSGNRTMPRHSAFSSSANWVICNVGGDRLRGRRPDRSILVRYEDFVAAPREAVAGIAAALGLPAPGAPFVDERTVDLPSNHTLAGNPSRFRTGPVALSEDDEWIHGQRRIDRAVCTAITLAFLRRYGYRLGVNRPAPEPPDERKRERP